MLPSLPIIGTQAPVLSVAPPPVPDVKTMPPAALYTLRRGAVWYLHATRVALLVHPTLDPDPLGAESLKTIPNVLSGGTMVERSSSCGVQWIAGHPVVASTKFDCAEAMDARETSKRMNVRMA